MIADMRSLRRGWLVAALLATVLTGAARDGWAQARSSITGTIRDEAGKALPDVSVTLESPAVPGRALTTLTNNRGAYRLSDLSPGLYELTATSQGRQTIKRSGLALPVATTMTVDVTLRATSEVVTLSGPAPIVDVLTAASDVS